MNSQKFDIVLLDADETIFDFLQAERLSLFYTAEKFGITASEDDAKVYSNINLSLWKELELGTVTREELKITRFKRWFDYLGVSADPVAFGKQYEYKLSQTGILFDDAESFVKKLSEHCRVYIVTNGLKNCQNGRMEKSPVNEYINGMYISEEIGFSKPDRRFFDHIFRDLNITDKSRVIIVGDSLSSDMLGGRNAHIATCRYIRNGVIEHNDLCDYEITDYNDFFDLLFN